MLMKFIARGTGDGKSAINYLFDEKNHKKELRTHKPEILRGNPEQTLKLIDSLQFKHKYSSAVIAFHPHDKPTDEQISETLDGFLKVAFAGLELDQYDYCAVLHREENSEHIHIIVPRVELTTGKSFNPAPIGWHHDFDPMRDYLNEKNGWISPDISQYPESARLIQPRMDGIQKDNGRFEVKKDIEEYLFNKVLAGFIQDRNDVIESLKALDFEINRVGKDYISVKFDNKKIRLKGALFNEEWKSTREIKAENTRAGDAAEVRKLRADNAYSEFERRIKWRITDNAKRYPRPLPDIDGFVKDKLTRKPERYSEPSTSYKVRVDKTVDNHATNIVEFNYGQLGIDVLSVIGDSNTININQAKRSHSDEAERHWWELESEQVRGESLCTDRRDETNVSRRLQGGEVNDDRTRKAAYGSDQTDGRASQQGNQDIGRATFAFSRASEYLERTISRYRGIITNGIERMIINSQSELDRFKATINLVEYAASCGYRIVKEKSSKSFKTMTKGKGLSSIVVYTGDHGDGLYFERGINKVKTVIDMCQEEQNANLGEVRKILRKWSGYSDVQHISDYKKPKPVEKDLVKVRSEVLAMSKVEPNNSYLKSRFINEKTLSDGRFLILKDKTYGNITFVHYDAEGEICGYEQRNKTFKSFSEGGYKGVWQSKNIGTASTVVICESGIDVLSHAQFKKTDIDVAYVSLCGEMSDKQMKVLMRVCRGKNVLIATDNDDAGERFAEKIKAAISDNAMSVVREKPKEKDWNDDLKKAPSKAPGLLNSLRL